MLFPYIYQRELLHRLCFLSAETLQINRDISSNFDIFRKKF
jgi:hypothetical protein